MTSLITDINEIEARRAGSFRRATFSADGNGTCVEVAPAQGESVLVRNSNRCEDGALLMPRRQFAALVDSIKDGSLDDLL